MRERPRNTSRARFLTRRNSERGVAMVSTLAVVVILGVIVTIVISNGSSGPTAPTVGGSTVGTTTTTSVKSIGNDATAAAVSTCLASYSEVNTALTYYKTLNGDSPPA